MQTAKTMGRPLKWTDAEAFEQAVNDFFETKEVPTWSGLALYLGFDSRRSLTNYKERPEFLPSIKKALLRIEEMYEIRMNTVKNPAGAIFALKNFGWQDKQEIQTTEIKKVLTVSSVRDYKAAISTRHEGGNGIPESVSGGVQDNSEPGWN